MSNSNKQMEAVRNVKTGALILLTPVNRKNLLNRSDMVSTMAVQNEKGAWVDANANQAVGNVAQSQSMGRIADTLTALNAQRDQLIAAALRIDGGAQYLKARGLIVPDNTVAKLPSGDPQPEPAPEPTPEPEKKTQTRSSRRKKRSARHVADHKPADSVEGL